MKILVFLFALAGTLGVSRADSYLYWLVPDEASGTDRNGATLAGPYTAKVVALKSESWTDKAGVDRAYLNIYSSVAGGAYIGNSVNVTIGSEAGNVPYFVNLAVDNAGSGWTYFVELYNDKGDTMLARSSEGLPYAQASIAALSGTIGMPSTPWMTASFIPVPEPNSAMLLLIGCAALALRRRKQIAA